MSSPAPGPGRRRRSAVGLVLENSATLGASELVARAIGFLATVYVARTLGVEAYGVIGFALAVTLYLWAAVDIGVELGGPREIARRPSSPDRGWVRGVILLRMMVAGVLAGLAVLIGLLVLPPPDGRIVALYGLTLFPVALGVRWVLIGFERTRAVAAGRLAAEAGRALVLVWLVRGAGDLHVVPIARFAAEGLVAAALVLVATRVRPVRPGPIDWGAATRVLRDTSPLAITTVLGLMVYNADLIMLRVFRSRADVGLYFAAFALVTLVGNVGHVLKTALIPTLTRVRSDRSQHADVWHAGVVLAVTLGLPIALAGWVLAADVLGTIFGPEFVSGAPALGLLVFSIPLLMARGAMEAVAVAEGRADIVLRETGLGAALNVTANLAAIPAFGLLGAASTTVATEVLRTGRLARHMGRLGIPPPRPGRFVPAIAATASMGLALRLVGPGRLWLSVLVGGVVFLGVIVLTGGRRAVLIRGTGRDESPAADQVEPEADEPE